MSIKGKLTLFVGLFFVFTSFCTMMAETPETQKQILKAGDVARFIKTFPLLKRDFEKYGAAYKVKEGNVTIPQAMKASQEFQGILKKHGWDEHFFSKFSAIVLSYTSIVYKKELKKAESKFEAAKKKIMENTAISDQMKKQMLAQMNTARGMLKTQGTIWGKRIHPKDIELVRPFVKELKKVLEDRGK